MMCCASDGAQQPLPVGREAPCHAPQNPAGWWQRQCATMALLTSATHVLKVSPPSLVAAQRVIRLMLRCAHVLGGVVA